MRASRLMAVAGMVGVLAVSGGTAFASGGVNSGGVNSGGGGGTPTTTAPASGGCAQITTFANSNGYYSVWAAIWTQFSIADSCGYPVSWDMSYTNGSTGAVDFARGSSTQYMPSGTIDEDWAAFSTAYTVTLTVTDPNGAVITSRSAVVTTKQPKSPGA